MIRLNSSASWITEMHAENTIHAEVGRRLIAGECVGDILLSEKNLLAKNGHGDTLMHLAARFNYLGEVPKANLNERTILMKNKDKESVVFAAATYGTLHLIPRVFLMDSVLLARNREGYNCLHAAAEGMQTAFIPKHLLNETRYKNLANNGFSPLHIAAQGASTFMAIPKALRHSSCLECPASDGITPLHILALHGDLHLLPLTQLTPERLMLQLKNCGGQHANKTVLDLVLPNEHDYFLGADMPSATQMVFGVDWWSKHQEIRSQKLRVADQLDTNDIGLF